MKRQTVLRRIQDVVASRGPEAHNHVQTDSIDMIFHRLATYGDLNATNMMPINDSKRGTFLLCNGDIYNYKHFSQKDCVSNNDCEVIPQMDYNPIQLRGVFAYLLWISKSRQLHIMRDAFGVRPLFRVFTPESHIYTSDIRVYALLREIYQEHELHIEEIQPGMRETWKVPFYKEPIRIVHDNWMSFPEPQCVFRDEPLSKYAGWVHNELLTAISVRVKGAKRKFGCLVSGGLDSSLVAGMVRRLLPSSEPLFTYSIGMQGATDEIHARDVAKFIGSSHTHFVVSKEEMLAAIPEVIRAIGSYDTTTVRASVGNYLVCKKIKEMNECTYLFNGDGADELMGGYLYMNQAPNKREFDKECRRLLNHIHAFDVLRSDRSIGGNGLAPRTPYLDIQFVRAYLTIPSQIRFKAHQIQEKYLIRLGAQKHKYIPSSVLWRKKEAMSDGVSSVQDSWHTTIAKHAESLIEGALEDQPEYGRTHNPPRTLEQIWYRRVFEAQYGKESATKLIPFFWMPRFVKDATDASARSLTLYEENQNSQHNIHQEQTSDSIPRS